MKLLKYITTSLLAIASIFNISAAEADSAIIKRTVTIEKNYIPDIQNAAKISELPGISEPELQQPEVNYSQYSTLMEPPYEIRPLEAARLKIPVPPERKNGYLRLGLGTSWTTLGDLIYPLINKPEYRLDFNANHIGTFKNRMHHDSELGLSFHRYYKSGNELTLNASYGFEGFNYYGKNKLKSDTVYTLNNSRLKGKDFFKDDAFISTWNLSGAYKSVFTEEKIQRYTLQLDYNGFSPNEGLKEHIINTNALYERKLDENKFGAILNLKNLIYNTNNANYTVFEQKGYSIFSLNPYFDFQQEKWKLHIGVNAAFSGQGRAFNPMPDITLDATLIDKALYFSGGIVGDLAANTMNDMEQLNRYMNLNEKVKNTYSPTNVYGNLKLKLLYNCSVDLKLGYKIVKDQYFFVNETLADTLTQTAIYANVFKPVYADANLLYSSIKLNYNLNQMLALLFDWRYNSWKLSGGGTAWQMPKNEFDIGIDLNLTKRLGANINCYFATGRKALALDGSEKALKSMADINLGVFYAHSSKVSMFLKFNNIINRHYEQWYGYEVNGFNAMIGLAFAF
ncbi:MAG: hypothetical protein LBR81_09990 [Prevotellaceae bacterium]|nr:hypothetical protein [Prevotellaceae bacterium]